MDGTVAVLPEVSVDSELDEIDIRLELLPNRDARALWRSSCADATHNRSQRRWSASLEQNVNARSGMWFSRGFHGRTWTEWSFPLPKTVGG